MRRHLIATLCTALLAACGEAPGEPTLSVGYAPNCPIAQQLCVQHLTWIAWIPIPWSQCTCGFDMAAPDPGARLQNIVGPDDPVALRLAAAIEADLDRPTATHDGVAAFRARAVADRVNFVWSTYPTTDAIPGIAGAPQPTPFSSILTALRATGLGPDL